MQPELSSGRAPYPGRLSDFSFSALHEHHSAFTNRHFRSAGPFLFFPLPLLSTFPSATHDREPFLRNHTGVQPSVVFFDPVGSNGKIMRRSTSGKVHRKFLDRASLQLSPFSPHASFSLPKYSTFFFIPGPAMDEAVDRSSRVAGY